MVITRKHTRSTTVFTITRNIGLRQLLIMLRPVESLPRSQTSFTSTMREISNLVSCGSVNTDPESPCYSVISEVDFSPACIDEVVSEASTEMMMTQ